MPPKLFEITETINMKVSQVQTKTECKLTEDTTWESPRYVRNRNFNPNLAVFKGVAYVP